MNHLIAKAEVLVEALPYIRKFAGKIFVIKYGGHAMVNEELKKKVIIDIILMKYIGIHPLLVHGGGNEINEWMIKLGREPAFSRGLRVTDKETMELAEMVLVGKVNRQIVSMINRFGGKAVGLSGKDSNLMMGRRIAPRTVIENGVEETIDLGYVGEVEKVNPEILNTLLHQDYIPVVSSIASAMDDEGEGLNINADYVAGDLAAALKAEKMILLTDVEGIMTDPDDPRSRISSLDEKTARRLIDEEKISKGMIPKVESCLRALNKGVCRTHIIDGRIDHALLLEIFTDQGIGTMVVNNNPDRGEGK